MATYEGRWDCPFCGSQNRGSGKHCVACGASRGQDVEFYLPENAEAIAQVEQARADAGPDWNCDSCGAANASTSSFCSGCGDPKQQTDVSKRVIEYGNSNVPKTSKDSSLISKNKEIERLDAAYSRAGSTLVKPKSAIRFVIPIVIILAFLSGLFYFLMPKEAYFTVSGHTWERKMDVENYKEIREDDWNVPSGGKVVSSRREVHHYDRVLDHYETRTRQVKVQVGTERYVKGKRDKGNGYFEDVYGERPIYENRTETYQEPIYRQVPIYQTKYTYDIWRWTVDRTLSASGSDKTVRWPEYVPENDKWRIGSKTGKYIIHLTDKKNKKYSKEMEYDRWVSFNAGQKIKVKKSPFGIEIPLQ